MLSHSHDLMTLFYSFPFCECTQLGSMSKKEAMGRVQQRLQEELKKWSFFVPLLQIVWWNNHLSNQLANFLRDMLLKSNNGSRPTEALEFPVELWRYLFHFLTVEQLLSCCQVCWFWQGFILNDDFWQTLCKNRFCDNPTWLTFRFPQTEFPTPPVTLSWKQLGSLRGHTVEIPYDVTVWNSGIYSLFLALTFIKKEQLEGLLSILVLSRSCTME